ncbi:uncharacterized protein KY384_006988 [Bacidia gigantensis]|uniref:uncharacterized protein n=1 Tax=Bacidia gigantensis TaxID=2732470 RepID=UPI001D03C60E|nr:uncharacterized protein KY384_006988 [Bacidia gigantensis]KAG8528072.1 hypothetical protein KY384_006988 [Bacidia gigantensis]
MADSLPAINFGFEELRDRMAKFTERFDDFIAKGRKRVLEERNQFRINVAELQEDQKMKSREMEILAQKTSQHNQTLQQQDTETAELGDDIEDVSQRKEAGSLSSKLSTSAHARDLSAQARLNLPELDFWESNLGMRIEGVKDDRLRFVFVNLDEREWAREAWFDLDMEKREYAIVEYRPKVEDSRVEECLEGLNASRDLGVFLKRMRVVFKEAVQPLTVHE